jgi:hypothetical protein
MFAILTHFSPLLTTFHASRQQKLIAFFAPAARPSRPSALHGLPVGLV